MLNYADYVSVKYTTYLNSFENKRAKTVKRKNKRFNIETFPVYRVIHFTLSQIDFV